MAVEQQIGWLLIVYAVAIFGTSVLGGYLPELVRMTHTRTQLVMAFVAGIILGVAIYHMLPHAVTAIGGPDSLEKALFWLMLGVLATLPLLYFFNFHEHDFSDEHIRQHDHGGQVGASLKPTSWAGIALGLGVHSLTEGIALSSTLRLSEHSTAGIAGLGVFLAIALHKPLDALSIVSMMEQSGLSVRARRFANFGFALICPIMIFVAYFVPSLFGPHESYIIGCALAFSTGTFLCISLSDLLPEIHFHRHDRWKIGIGFLLGVGIAYALHWIEPTGLHGISPGG